MGATPPMTDTALEYHRRGLAVIPTSGKKARFDWKQFQRERPIEGMLHDWFGRLSEGTTGLAVVLGKVSGMLAVRDFDQSDAYDGWAKSHPNLADTLPTVTTARGRHVYFRTRKEVFADLSDGELRGDSKHYVLVPPSLHPSGVIYRWTIPLPEGPLPVLDPRKAGFLDAATCNTASTGNKEGAVPAVSAVLHGLPVGAGEAVAGTLPVGAGERNRRLFDL